MRTQSYARPARCRLIPAVQPPALRSVQALGAAILVAVALLWSWGVAQANADAPPGTVLLETFEGGAPGWQFSGMWHIQERPETLSVSPDINPPLITLPDAGHLPSAFDGTHVAWFGDPASGTFCSEFQLIPQSPKNGCTSNGPQSGYIESPSFDLSGATTAELSFYSWWEIESVDADRYDVMSVEYSIDGGASWAAVASLNPTNNPAGHDDQSYAADGLGEPPAWHHYIADLSPAAGHADVRIRFNFSTNDELYNGFRGWMIDNVTVSAPFTAPPPQVSLLSPACVQENSSTLVSAYGEHFVLGSRLLIDGSPVTGATPSDERVELLASLSAGPHIVQVESPNGSISNVATLQAASACGAPPGRYVALGDSYSAGEGVPPFLLGTNTGSDQCHRSPEAYPELLVQRHAGGIIPGSVEFFACSGSELPDFSSTNHLWAESPQLGDLAPSDATLLTFSIGGNDIGFTHIGETCLNVQAAWLGQNPHYQPDCRTVLNSDTMNKIAHLGLAPLFDEIRKAAPYAEVYVMGYPGLLPANPSGPCKAQAYREDGSKATTTPWQSTSGFVGIETALDEQDVTWIDTVVQRLNTKIATEAAAAGFHYVDNTNAFAGHDVCSNSTDASDRPWGHGLVLENSANNPSVFSFHPNGAGQEAMEEDLYRAIAGGSQLSVQQGQTSFLSIVVAAGQALLNVITHWPGSDVVTSLVSPSGQEFDRSSQGVNHFATATSENYVIANPEPGTWSVRLYGANVHVGESARVDTTTVPKAAAGPTAVMQLTPDRGVAPTEVAFDGSASSAAGGQPTTYSWDFGDGSAPASGAKISHTYAAAGVYRASLTVTDGSGQTNTVGKPITVAAVAGTPVARLEAYVDPSHDSQAYLDGTKSESPDGEVVSYHWDFGDGTNSTEQHSLHEYIHNGTYTVTLTVTDNHGQSGSATQALTVTSVPESASVLEGSGPFESSPLTPVGGVAGAKSARFSILKAVAGRHGAIRLTLRAPSDGGFSVRADLAHTIKHGRRGHRRTVFVPYGAAHTTASAGTVVTIVIKPAAKARAALTHARRSTVKITIVFAPRGAASQTQVVGVLVKGR